MTPQQFSKSSPQHTTYIRLYRPVVLLLYVHCRKKRIMCVLCFDERRTFPPAPAFPPVYLNRISWVLAALWVGTRQRSHTLGHTAESSIRSRPRLVMCCRCGCPMPSRALSPLKSGLSAYRSPIARLARSLFSGHRRCCSCAEQVRGRCAACARQDRKSVV